MPRKKLTRKIKQILIHVGNVTETIQFDSNEKPTISDEEQKQKIKKIQKEIIKIQTNAQTNTNQINYNNNESKLLVNSGKQMQHNQKYNDFYQNINLNDLETEESKNQKNYSTGRLDNLCEDYFEDFLYGFI